MSSATQPSHPHLWRYLSVIGVLAALLTLGLVPRLHAQQKAKAAVAANAIAKVRVVHPQGTPPQTTMSMPATLEAWSDAAIRARSSGYVEHWYADIGTHVTAGQTLATLIAPELQAALQQARGEESAAQANFDIATITARRWQDMLRQKATSAQEAEQRSADLESRRAQLASAKANVARLAQSVTYTRIVAPFDGIITARGVDIGTLVDAGAATELFHEAQSARLRAVLSVPDDQAAAVRAGMSAQVQIGTRVIEATVARTAAAIDLTSRMQRVEVDLPNDDGSLLPGQYARVVLTTNAHLAGNVVPVEAVLFRPDGAQIAVVGTDSKVSLQKVHVLRDLGTQVLIDPALAAGTNLVANPGDSITAGDSVQIVPPAGNT